MRDKEKASKLAREGFDLWQSGKLEEAIHSYRQALTCADPDHYGTPDYRGEFAGVLAALGRDQESREQYERSLSETIRQAGSENTNRVMVARYFLGLHLLKMHQPEAALAAVEPSLSLGHQRDSHLRIVQAHALWQLSRGDEARRAARIALEAASSDEERQRIREEVKEVLQH